MSKVWFITGAGSGIGAATARAVLRAGDRVVATARNLDKARNALSDVAGDNLAFVQLDALDRSYADSAFNSGAQPGDNGRLSALSPEPAGRLRQGRRVGRVDSDAEQPPLAACILE